MDGMSVWYSWQAEASLAVKESARYGAKRIEDGTLRMSPMLHSPERVSKQQWLRNEQPLVSICCPTYQHAAFITAAIEGFLMQETTFPVEILIGEDESSDGTREICQRVAAEHPDQIKLFLRERKDVLYFRGRPSGRSNFLGLLADARGKYIALCEGDDFWTDPLKLQKQVDFMEGHPEYTLCFHRADLLKDGTLQHFPIPPDVDLSDVRFDDLLRHYNFITTASTMYRSIFRPIPEWFLKVPFLDKAMHAFAADKGKVQCLTDYMAVWRHTGNGGWTGLDTQEQGMRMLMFFDLLQPHLTATQRSILAIKYRELFTEIAMARYPARPRMRLLYERYLATKHLLSMTFGR